MDNGQPDNQGGPGSYGDEICKKLRIQRVNKLALDVFAQVVLQHCTE